MAVRRSAVYKNHKPAELSPLKHLVFHNGCLSRPYLEKYKRDWN